MEVLTASIRDWQARGRSLELAGLEVFTVDSGPAGTREAVVLLHGFPSSCYDWRQAMALLTGRRVVTFDLPGFGLSAKPVDYSYSLLEQADIVELALRALGIDTAHVVAHDMGTSVACELMARRERGLLAVTVRSLALMNGSVHLELAKLTPSQKLLRSWLGPVFAKVSSGTVFRSQLKRILGKPIDEHELEDMWAQLLYRDGKLRLPAISSYLDERVRFRHRWIGALTRLDIPTLVLWGTVDPVAVFAIAEQLAAEIPTARLERLERIGHYPQLEDPAAVAATVNGFLDGVTGG